MRRYVYDFVRVRVYQNTTVQVTAQYLDASTYNVTMSEQFVCMMDDGGPDATGGWTAYAAAPSPSIA